MRTLLVGAWAAAHIGKRIITPISEYKESNPLIPVITHCVQSRMFRRLRGRPLGLGTATFIRARLGDIIATLTILRTLRTVHRPSGSSRRLPSERTVFVETTQIHRWGTGCS